MLSRNSTEASLMRPSNANEVVEGRRGLGRCIQDHIFVTNLLVFLKKMAPLLKTEENIWALAVELWSCLLCVHWLAGFQVSSYAFTQSSRLR